MLSGSARISIFVISGIVKESWNCCCCQGITLFMLSGTRSATAGMCSSEETFNRPGPPIGLQGIVVFKRVVNVAVTVLVTTHDLLLKTCSRVKMVSRCFSSILLSFSQPTRTIAGHAADFSGCVSDKSAAEMSDFFFNETKVGVNADSIDPLFHLSGSQSTAKRAISLTLLQTSLPFERSFLTQSQW